jgi:hypothetical protein
MIHQPATKVCAGLTQTNRNSPMSITTYRFFSNRPSLLGYSSNGKPVVHVAGFHLPRSKCVTMLQCYLYILFTSLSTCVSNICLQHHLHSKTPSLRIRGIICSSSTWRSASNSNPLRSQREDDRPQWGHAQGRKSYVDEVPFNRAAAPTFTSNDRQVVGLWLN